MTHEDFHITFDTYYKRLVVYACRFVDVEEARDVVQTVFVKLWEREREPESVKAFLFTSVRNMCVDMIRLQQVKRKHEKSAPMEFDLDTEIVLADTISVLAKAMQTMSVKEREVVSLAFYEGRSIADVASLLHRPYKTIATLKDRGIAKMRQFFRSHPHLREDIVKTFSTV